MINERNYLIFHITRAFKDVELDGGIGLSEANAIVEQKGELIRSECKKQDEKLQWNNISSDKLNQFNTSLSGFDAKGMRFHLPAFIIAEMKDEYRFSLAFFLTTLSDFSKYQFSLLTKLQRAAVKLYLEHLMANPDYEFEAEGINIAIEEYWLK